MKDDNNDCVWKMTAENKTRFWEQLLKNTEKKAVIYFFFPDKKTSYKNCRQKPDKLKSYQCQAPLCLKSSLLQQVIKYKSLPKENFI